jgi:hypothetical protein
MSLFPACSLALPRRLVLSILYPVPLDADVGGPTDRYSGRSLQAAVYKTVEDITVNFG